MNPELEELRKDPRIAAALDKIEEDYLETVNVTFPAQQAAQRAAHAAHLRSAKLCWYEDLVDDDSKPCETPATNRIMVKPPSGEVLSSWRFFARACDVHLDLRLKALRKWWKVVKIEPFDPDLSQEPIKASSSKS